MASSLTITEVDLMEQRPAEHYELVFREQRVRAKEQQLKELEYTMRLQQESELQAGGQTRNRVEQAMTFVASMQRQVALCRQQYRSKLEQMALLHADNLRHRSDLDYYRQGLTFALEKRGQALIEHLSVMAQHHITSSPG